MSRLSLFLFSRISVHILPRHRYIVSSREVKRFEAVTRSPLYADFSSTLTGLPTIRAYQAQRRFRDEFLREMDDNSAW
jgi:ABC-type multidrug transport system fused ATPase/permease subunit